MGSRGEKREKSIDAGCDDASLIPNGINNRQQHLVQKQVILIPNYTSSIGADVVNEVNSNIEIKNHSNGHIITNIGNKDRNQKEDKMKSCNEDRTNHNDMNVVPVVKYSNEEVESTCGILSFRPKWLQSLANKQVFLIVFSLTSILQGMYYTYFVSVLTTIEKLYQIQSKTTGIIMSATEVGQIGGALLLTYYGGQGHRPKWIAGGMIIFAIASFICSTPHFLFGGQSLLSNLPKSSVESSLESVVMSTTRADFAQSLCFDYNNGSSVSSFEYRTNRSHPSSVKCENEDLKSAQSKITSSVITIFCVSLFLIGIGSTAVNTLGIPYIDDNVAPRESPLYFGTILIQFLTLHMIHIFFASFSPINNNRHYDRS